MHVTLQNIDLKEHSLNTLDLLNKLRKEHFQMKAEVCIERAKYVTEYLKYKASNKDPIIIRYAKAVNYFLSNKAPLFFDDNLLAGTTTSKPLGAPVYPELTGMTIWPELDTMSTREKNPQILSPEEAEELNFEIFPYWIEGNVLEYTKKKYGNVKCIELFQQFVFFLATKSGCISHTVPNYKVVLEKGLEYIIEEASSKEGEVARDQNPSSEDQQKIDFYKAVQITMEGIITYANNLAKKAKELSAIEQDEKQKENLIKMAETCSRVPAKPARTFREAVNSIWIVQIAIHAENINMAMSPGRLDQVLYKYYWTDINNGSITIKEAMEIIGCLWLKLNDNTNLVPETAEELFGGAGTVPAVTIGGVDEKGEDAVNDLTYAMLRITELLKTKDPSMNARYHYEKNSKEYRNRVAEVIAATKSVPAFHNDVADIRTLENQGIKTEHARDYAIIGCVELSAAGRSYDASSAIMFNLASALELALYNGRRPVTGEEIVGKNIRPPEECKSFEEFWELFKKHLTWLLEEAIQLNEYMGKTHQEILPTPLLSTFFEGPMEKGRDLIFGGALYNSSGVTHIGFADTVDSLNAIERTVFMEKKCTFKELLNALQNNFEGYEKLHSYLVHKTPKYGTEDKIAIKNSQNLVRFLYEFYQNHTNYRGGKYRPAYWTMTNHAGQGKLCGALPSGRKAYKIFASGITPVSQATPNIAACFNAVGGLGADYIPGGEALNMKFPEIENDEDIRRLGDAVEAYFRSGGLHVQFNIMNYQMLLDAKKYPEKYPELLVRVSGYSAYFKDLNEAMKDEIITRTEYNIRSGQAVPFPSSEEDMLGFN